MTPERIKIAYLTPSVRMFGARQSLFQLARCLDAQFQPIVVCPRPGDLEAALREAGIATKILPLPPWRKGKFFFARWFRLRQLRQWAAAEKIQLLHANDFHANPYAVRAGQSLGIPAVTHLRLTISSRQIRNYAIDRTQRVICVSRAAADDLRGLPELQNKIRVIYNGLDFAEFEAQAGVADFRRELGAAPEDFILGQVGLLDERKQQHVVLQAFNALADRFPRLRLAIIGAAADDRSPYALALRKAIDARRAPQRVQLLPFRENIAPVFAGIDLNLLISNREGFGRVIIEAGCFGKPSIGTRVGGIPEVIEDGRTGLLVECGDAEALAAAIASLLENPERHRALAANVKKFVREKFSIAAHVAQMQAVYQELLSVSSEQ